MDILWVTPQIPGLRSGGQVRQYNLLKLLSRKHRISVLSLALNQDFDEIKSLENLGIEVITVPYTIPEQLSPWRNRFHAWSQLLFDPQPHFSRVYPLFDLSQQLKQFISNHLVDIIHFELLYIVPLSKVTNGNPWVICEHNVEYRKCEQQMRLATSGIRKFANWLEMMKLRKWEKRWVRRSPACISVSETDAGELVKLAQDTPIYLVPNGVDADYFTKKSTHLEQRSGLLFFGNLGYRPNIDAVIYFCREIFPIIQSSNPNIILTIIGAYASSEVVNLGKLPGVRYIGYVEDVRPYLWTASVCIVPLRSGSGTRLKILESLAADCPVVTTSIGVEGLNLVDEQDLLIVDDPQEFAVKVIRILRNDELALNLAKHGCQTVKAHYDWQVIAPRLEQTYLEIIEAHRA